MKINGMAEFQEICLNKLIARYAKLWGQELTMDEVRVIWACQTFNRYQLFATTTIPLKNIYFGYTYDGEQEELHENIYGKFRSECYED